MRNNLNIKIDDAVFDRMRKKGKSVLTLSVNTTGGGCCPTFELAEITFGVPEKTAEYDELKQDGLRIFIAKNVRLLTSTLRFTLKKGLIGSSIEVEGLSLKKREG